LSKITASKRRPVLISGRAVAVAARIAA